MKRKWALVKFCPFVAFSVEPTDVGECFSAQQQEHSPTSPPPIQFNFMVVMGNNKTWSQLTNMCRHLHRLWRQVVFTEKLLALRSRRPDVKILWDSTGTHEDSVKYSPSCVHTHLNPDCGHTFPCRQPSWWISIPQLWWIKYESSVFTALFDLKYLYLFLL